MIDYQTVNKIDRALLAEFLYLAIDIPSARNFFENHSGLSIVY